MAASVSSIKKQIVANTIIANLEFHETSSHDRDKVENTLIREIPHVKTDLGETRKHCGKCQELRVRKFDA